MPINLIYAKSRNGVIGLKNALPWHLPEDLAHFKKTTLGQPVIMGRNTWNSLPAAARPLPGRRNIVVTRASFDPTLEGAEVAGSMMEASLMVPPGTEAWVIGGTNLFQYALPVARRVIVTEIDEDFNGDVFAPVLSRAWVETSRVRNVSKSGLKFDIVTYGRVVPLQKATPADDEPLPFPDKGPWSAQASQNGETQKVFVESHHFDHDVRLYVDGDFRDIRAKLEYARGLAKVLNQATAEPRPVGS